MSISGVHRSVLHLVCSADPGILRRAGPAAIKRGHLGSAALVYIIIAVASAGVYTGVLRKACFHRSVVVFGAVSSCWRVRHPFTYSRNEE